MFKDIIEVSNDEYAARSRKLSRVKIASLMNPDVAFLANVGIDKPQRIVKNDTNIEAAAYTDGRSITFFQDTVDNLDTKDLLFIYLHECSHIALNHVHWLKSTANCTPKRLNKAMDYRINYDLEKMLKQKTPKGMLIDAKYDENWTIAEIYDDLPEDDPNDTDGSYDLDDSNPPSVEEHAADINNAVNRTIAQGNGSSIPEEIKKFVDDFYRPKVDTGRLLRKYASEYIREGYDFNRPNRRYKGVFVPSRRSKGKTEVAIILDTSYSVSDEEVNIFLNEVHDAIKNKAISKVYAVQFHDVIAHEAVIKSTKDIERLVTDSRGGTNIEPVLAWLDEHKPKVAMVFTDGYFSFSREAAEMPSTDIIWCINNTHGFKPPKGKVIEYEPDK